MKTVASRLIPRLRCLAFCGALGLLPGCMSALDNAPSSPSKPWVPQSERKDDGSALPPPAGAADFGVPPVAQAAMREAPPTIRREKSYSLPELIDLAQQRNPATRVAWQAARQAALGQGMVEATYLPLITASVLAGHQEVKQSLPVEVGNIRSVKTTLGGVSPQIAMQWLVFDFGQRSALAAAAKHNATAANVLFNGLHQKIIADVTRAYFLYGAARAQVRVAGQALANAQEINNAAEARLKAGRGTTVETAQARQQLAQAKYGKVQAEGNERLAYQALLGAMGLPPETVIRIDDPSRRPLPGSVATPTEQVIRSALARRPDVLASYSAMKASQAGVAAARAEFLPKVYLGAMAATGSSDLSAGNLPGIGQQASSAGILIGATVPIFDGGLRRNQLKNAQSVADAAQATFQQTQETAAREIFMAATTLQSALASYQAASELVRAAQVSYDATLESYRAGVGTADVAAAASTALLEARRAQSDAHAASLVAAANLAFALGSMTSADVPLGLMGR